MLNAAFSGADLYVEYATLLLVSVIVARQLSPELYGTYTLLLWFAATGIVLANNGITTGVMKFLGEARGQGSAALARRVLGRLERLQLGTALGAVALLAALFLVLPHRLVPDPDARMLLWVLLPAVFFRSMYVYYFSAAKGYEDFRIVARVKLVVAPLYLVLVAALALAGLGLAAFVWAYAAGTAVYAGVMRMALMRSRRGVGRSGGGGDGLNEALRSRVRRHVGWASAIVVLDLLVLRQTEVFFLGMFSTREAIGYYGLGRGLAASVVLLIPGVFTALLLPAMSRTYGRDPELMRSRFLAATRYIVLLAVPLVAVCEVFAADLILLLYGEAYEPATMVFRVSVAASAIGAVSASASSYQLSTDRQAAVVGIMAVAAVVTLVLDVVLIRAFGLTGAIIAGASGAVLLSLGLLTHAYRTLRVRPEWGAYVRAAAAGAIAVTPVLAAQLILPWWLAIPVGAAMFVPAYAALTVAFGTWNPADLRFLDGVLLALPHRLADPARALLAVGPGLFRQPPPP